MTIIHEAIRFLIILQSIAALDGKIHRLNRLYKYCSSLDLNFHCQKNTGQKAMIVIYSGTRINFTASSILHQIQSDSWYCNCFFQIELYEASQCTEYINITTTNNFEIFQQLQSPIQLNLTRLDQLYQNYHKLMLFNFTISREHLFTLKINNYRELHESFIFILNNGQLSQQLQRVDNSNYIRVLSPGPYQLFILGPKNLRISLQLETEYVGQQFIWINSPQELLSIEFESQFNHQIITGIREQSLYLQMIIGSCNVTLFNMSKNTNAEVKDLQQLTLEQHTLYLIENPFKIVFTGKPFIILHQSLNQIQQKIFCQLVIYVSQKSVRIDLWFINKIEIETNNTNINIVNLVRDYYSHGYTLELHFNQTFQIFYFQIHPSIIDIPNQDIFQLLLPSNSSIICKDTSNTYLFNVMNGKFNYSKLSGNLIQINTQEDTIIDLIKLEVKQFKKVVFNQLYKSHKLTKFYLTLNYQYTSFKINVYPTDTRVYIYHDYELKYRQVHTGDFIHLDYETKEYRYILIEHDIDYYVQFQRGSKIESSITGQINAIMLFKLREINLTQEIYDSIYFFGFQDIKFRLVQIDGQAVNAIFLEVYPIVIVLMRQQFPFERLNLNQFYPLVNTTIYLIYLQTNFILLVLDEFHASEQIQVRIINPELELLQYVEDGQCQEFTTQEMILDENSIVHIQSQFQILNLSFFECYRIDCVIQLRLISKQFNNSIKYQTCLDISVGMLYFTDILYACQAFEQFEIIPLSGQINLVLKQNLIECFNQQCCIIIKNPNMTLYQIQQDVSQIFTIPLNQLNFNVESQFPHVIFYNNISQKLHIQTDHKKFQLKKLIGSQYIAVNSSSIFYEYGYYSVNLDANSYISIFTFPTPLYENITYTIRNQEQFTIGKTDKSYLLIKSSIDSSLTYNVDFMNQKFEHNYQSILLKQISQIIELQGNGSIKCYYISNPCFFVSRPKLEIFQYKSLVFRAKLNQQCQIISIELTISNITQINNNHHIYLIFHNYTEDHNDSLALSYQIKGNYNIIRVISDEHTYDFQVTSKVQYYQDNLVRQYYAYITFMIVSLLIRYFINLQKYQVITMSKPTIESDLVEK